jgi:hypothetical protein
MPNWVFNSLLIEAEPQVISKIKAQVSAPYENEHLDWRTNQPVKQMVEQPFSFWNIIKPTNLDAYHDKPNAKQDLSEADHWYNWNIRNWGVKWEAKEVYENESDESMLSYNFDTPWGVAEEAMLELSRQYPTAKLSLEFEEEQGWGGEVVFTNGESEIIQEYNDKCRQCGALDVMDYCDTCECNVCAKCNYAEFAPEIMCETHKEKEKANV